MVYQKRGHENCILENNVDIGSFLSQSITKLLSQISIYGNLHIRSYVCSESYIVLFMTIHN